MVDSQATSTTAYTVWNDCDRHLLVCLLGYLALASSLTANIYFPLIDLLARQYEVSIQAINLTITLFMVIQGIAPSFWSPLSDSWGRRPVYLTTFTVYTLASLGLSIVERNYPALLVLRAIQSAGGSAVLSLAYAAVADVSVHAQRGKFLAPMLAATNIGPCIGPIIGGGAVLASGDPRWSFRALLIFGGSGVLLIGWAMPETNRTVVGNGSVPPQGIWKTWWSLIFPSKRTPSQPRQKQEEPDTRRDMESREKGGAVLLTSLSPLQEKSSRFAKIPTGCGTAIVPNPFRSIRTLFYPDTALVLWLAGSPYALWFGVQTTFPPLFAFQYNFNPLEVGCCFLSGGVGVILGGFIAGRLMDWNYKSVAKASGFTIDPVHGDDVDGFPIEKARSRGSIIILISSMIVVVGYGWALERKAHPAILLVLQAYIGCKCTILLQIYSALIVDIFPKATGTAAAANNIVRCTLAAGAVAALDPLSRVIGHGWVFTLLGLLDAGVCVVAVLTLRRWGRSWRKRRKGTTSELP